MIEKTIKMIEAIVTDIEGTTTPITFVHDILFPYFVENVKVELTSEYVEQNGPELQNAVMDLIRKSRTDEDYKKENDVLEFSIMSLENTLNQVSDYSKWLTKIDRKDSSLKILQGYIFKAGYLKGVLKGDVYEDVNTNLKKWNEKNIKLYVYSSGSVSAQKSLFNNTKYGDLSILFKDNFDTLNIGNKRNKESYLKISKTINIQPNNILFLTDVLQEALSAQEIGFKVIVLNRPGNLIIENKVLDEHNLIRVNDFNEVNELIEKNNL